MIGAYPLFIERQLVHVKKYAITLRKLPKAFDGFTVVQLTDVHHGFLVSKSFVKRIIDRVKGIPRDMIVLTGDYVHEQHDNGEIDAVHPELGNLRAPYGVHAVLGNHDHWANRDKTIYWLERNRQSLRHQVKCIERGDAKLWLIGAGDLWEDHKELDEITGDIPMDQCKIVLAHNPDTADTFYENSIDLFLCGHTHGGQVKIPFLGAPILPVKNKAYSSGLCYAKNKTPVFISKGIGWAILPIRFNCYPEISVITLKSV